MKKYKMLTILAIAGFLFAAYPQAGYTGANSLNAVGLVVVKGRVDVCKDPSGLITSVKILTRKRTYSVILDDNGNFLAGGCARCVRKW